MGRRGLPRHLRQGSGNCVASPGGGPAAGVAVRPVSATSSERGPLPGRRRHRQQLQRFPVADRQHPCGRFGRRREQHQSHQRGDFAAGQTIIIDTGANRETAVIATVGTPGGTTVGTATDVGATVIPVASAVGFSAGQTITIDSGTNRETAVVASVTGGAAAAAAEAALAAPQSPSPRRSLWRMRWMHRSPAAASLLPLH